MHLPNGSIHMRSKEKELNFTDYKQLKCYRYIEENDTIEELFYQSNDSKLCKLFATCLIIIIIIIIIITSETGNNNILLYIP